ncbi:hypothetical protein F383_23522 [Gossypium arboreum]|uniref:Uncharacterized protein n=1 Tax=Gossypium arboreum TaxID=29729 RepID=A0A0B0NS20_GOSAR|nr:hypothetical protein F383_23522 [Gossypium arboreum]
MLNLLNLIIYRSR